MSERKWTQQQRSAIDAHGGTLLISAAAGSGKTAVLVQRVIERLISNNPDIHCDADRLLIVTFTRAAAAEMKERISAELQSRILADPWNTGLRKQMILLKKAQISTMHSFCSKLIRDNFYKLGISPDFRIADSAELKILREDCIADVLEKYYASDDKDFLELVEQLIGNKNDSDLASLIDSMEYYISSYPFPEDFLDSLEKAYDAGSPEKTIWAQSSFDYVRNMVDYAFKYNELACEIAENDEKMSEKYLPSFLADAKMLSAIRSAANACDWDALYKACAAAEITPLGRAAKLPYEAAAAKAAREIVKETFGKLKSTIISDREVFVKELEFTGRMIHKLVEIMREYMELLKERKARRKILDYNDLEHYSVMLLLEKNPDINPDEYRHDDYFSLYRKTEIAVAVTENYDEIMLDEYQDTNTVQNLIFSAVAKNAPEADRRALTDGINMFMVGDMKQSIYRFRKAVPELFMDKFRRFNKFESTAPQYPALITLGANFRSRNEVTDSINYIFSQIMSEEMGGVTYDDNQKLIARASYPYADNMAAEIHFISKSASSSLSSAQYESEYIAQLIADMISDGFMVTDKSTGCMRPAECRDFCILRRNMAGKGENYVDSLEVRGIKSWISAENGLLGTDEANIVLSLLRVINNPLADIPLMCTMLSPIFGFTPDELAEIRLKERTAPLYGAVLSIAHDGNEKCSAFLKTIDKFRLISATSSTDKLMDEIFYSTGYMAAVSSMPNGEIRLGSLRLLREFAAKCEVSGTFGLSSFISTIDRMIEQGEDLPGASQVTESANVVRIMTIHKSKGLEFPICIVAGLGSQFNKDGDTAGVMMHNDLLLGMKMKENGVYYETQLRRSIANSAYIESVNEEMRVLYVALTRAKEKLIMVSTPRSISSCVNTAAMNVFEGDIAPFALAQCNSYAAWLMTAVIRHPESNELRALSDFSIDTLSHEQPPLKVIVKIEDSDFDEQTASVDETISDYEKKKPVPDIVAEIEKRISYVYPYEALINIPTKVTASELTKQENSGDSISLMRPAFMMRGGLTPTERGQALHKFMEFASFKAAADNPQAELNRLVQYGFLTQLEADAVDLERVKTFFMQMKNMLDGAKEIMREREFSVKLDEEYSKIVTDVMPDGDCIVLEGECDCVLDYGESAVILDYKTDRISDPEKLIAHYGTQLRLYKYAMEKVLDKPVSGIYLYSFYLDKLIEV